MSALGQKRTYAVQQVMSALHPIATLIASFGMSALQLPSAQLLDTTRRTVPPMAHGGLIGDANAFAAAEKPSAGVPILRIQDAPFAMAFIAHEQEVTPAEMCFSPMAANNLLKGLQRFAAR